MTIRATTLSKPPSSSEFWKQKKTRVYIFTQRAYSRLLNAKGLDPARYYFVSAVVIPYVKYPLEFPVTSFKEGKVTIYYQANYNALGDISKVRIWSKQFIKIPWKTNPNDSTHKACQLMEEVLAESEL